MGAEEQRGSSARSCVVWRGVKLSPERAPGHGKGPGVVLVRLGKLQARCQAGSSGPDPLGKG